MAVGTFAGLYAAVSDQRWILGVPLPAWTPHEWQVGVTRRAAVQVWGLPLLTCGYSPKRGRFREVREFMRTPTKAGFVSPTGTSRPISRAARPVMDAAGEFIRACGVVSGQILGPGRTFLYGRRATYVTRSNAVIS
jgi:hypothetical protein